MIEKFQREQEEKNRNYDQNQINNFKVNIYVYCFRGKKCSKGDKIRYWELMSQGGITPK